MCKFCFFASKTWFSCNTCTQSHLKKQKHLRRFFSQLHLLLPVLLVFINRYEPCPCIYLKLLIKWLIQILVIFSIVCSSYGLLAYFSYIYISGKNVVISQQKWQHFCQKWKNRKYMQVDHNLIGLWIAQPIQPNFKENGLDLLSSLAGIF